CSYSLPPEVKNSEKDEYKLEWTRNLPRYPDGEDEILLSWEDRFKVWEKGIHLVPSKREICPLGFHQTMLDQFSSSDLSIDKYTHILVMSMCLRRWVVREATKCVCPERYYLSSLLCLGIFQFSILKSLSVSVGELWPVCLAAIRVPKSFSFTAIVDSLLVVEQYDEIEINYQLSLITCPEIANTSSTLSYIKSPLAALDVLTKMINLCLSLIISCYNETLKRAVPTYFSTHSSFSGIAACPP
ncbi:464_t:CDS:2, partial [Acaulospora colombiana]